MLIPSRMMGITNYPYSPRPSWVPGVFFRAFHSSPLFSTMLGFYILGSSSDTSYLAPFQGLLFPSKVPPRPTPCSVDPLELTFSSPLHQTSHFSRARRPPLPFSQTFPFFLFPSLTPLALSFTIPFHTTCQSPILFPPTEADSVHVYAGLSSPLLIQCFV